MFMVDRWLTSMSLAVLYSETGTIYLPLEIVLAIKFCPLLMFHTETENLMLLCISVPASRHPHCCLYLPNSPTDGHQEGDWASLAPPTYIKTFNAVTQK